jgi:hypothetical protein
VFASQQSHLFSAMSAELFLIQPDSPCPVRRSPYPTNKIKGGRRQLQGVTDDSHFPKFLQENM